MGKGTAFECDRCRQAVVVFGPGKEVAAACPCGGTLRRGGATESAILHYRCCVCKREEKRSISDVPVGDVRCSCGQLMLIVPTRDDLAFQHCKGTNCADSAGCVCGCVACYGIMETSLTRAPLPRGTKLTCIACGFAGDPGHFVESAIERGKFLCAVTADCVARARGHDSARVAAEKVEGQCHCRIEQMGCLNPNGRCACRCKICKSDAFDSVNRPAHYADRKIEVIDFIIDSGWGEGFCLGNAVKYVARAGKKDPDKKTEDLEKARWYLDRWIKEEKKAKEGKPK